MRNRICALRRLVAMVAPVHHYRWVISSAVAQKDLRVSRARKTLKSVNRILVAMEELASTHTAHISEYLSFIYVFNRLDICKLYPPN